MEKKKYGCDTCPEEITCEMAYTEAALQKCVGARQIDISKECPFCGRELIESANPDELECENCGIDFVVRGGELEEVNDQTAKADKGKPKLTLVPRQIIYDIAEVREYGNNKYPEGGPDNWKKVSAERYRDAAYRHWLEYLEDPESVDEESGIKHLKHLACNIAFLCEFDKMEEYITFHDTMGRPYFEMKVGDVLNGAWKQENS